MTKPAWQRRVTTPSAIAVAITHGFDHCLLAAQLKLILELALFRRVALTSLARICFVAPALQQREQLMWPRVRWPRRAGQPASSPERSGWR